MSLFITAVSIVLFLKKNEFYFLKYGLIGINFCSGDYLFFNIGKKNNEKLNEQKTIPIINKSIIIEEESYLFFSINEVLDNEPPIDDSKMSIAIQK